MRISYEWLGDFLDLDGVTAKDAAEVLTRQGVEVESLTMVDLSAIVIGKIRESKDNNFGYNAQTGKFEDLVKAGVIDPTKVTRTALQNAGSIAGLMLTTEALVSELPEEKKEAPASGGHGGMGGMY